MARGNWQLASWQLAIGKLSEVRACRRFALFLRNNGWNTPEQNLFDTFPGKRRAGFAKAARQERDDTRRSAGLWNRGRKPPDRRAAAIGGGYKTAGYYGRGQRKRATRTREGPGALGERHAWLSQQNASICFNKITCR
jgi:hypothetical protein